MSCRASLRASLTSPISPPCSSILSALGKKVKNGGRWCQPNNLGTLARDCQALLEKDALQLLDEELELVGVGLQNDCLGGGGSHCGRQIGDGSQDRHVLGDLKQSLPGQLPGLDCRRRGLLSSSATAAFVALVAVLGVAVSSYLIIRDER